MLTTLALAAAASAEAAADSSHMLEWILALATTALAIVTAWAAYVTAKLARATERDAATLANNSVDSMENVAVTALDHFSRTQELRRLAAERRRTRRHGRH